MPLENLLVMALALGAGGLVKGAAGMGLPLVALPILAAFLGVQHAVALMCFPIIITNFWQTWRLRTFMREADFVPAMTVGGAAGMLIGTWFIVTLPEGALSVTLALIVLAYVGLRLASPHFILPKALGQRLAPGIGLGAGMLQGATGIASPLSVTFIHAMRLSRGAHVYAVSTTFLLYTMVQVPALFVAGVMTWPIVLEGLVAIVPALALMPVGNWLAGRISQTVFDRVVMGLLVIVALQLVWKSFGL